MTNEEKAQEISEKYKHYNVECSSLDCYLSALEMAKYKDRQPQIIEIFGKRVKVVEEKEIHYTCKHCCFDMECRKIKGLFRDSMICKDSNKKVNRYFVEVDEDGNELIRKEI